MELLLPLLYPLRDSKQAEELGWGSSSLLFFARAQFIWRLALKAAVEAWTRRASWVTTCCATNRCLMISFEVSFSSRLHPANFSVSKRVRGLTLQLFVPAQYFRGCLRRRGSTGSFAVIS